MPGEIWNLRGAAGAYPRPEMNERPREFGEVPGYEFEVPRAPGHARHGSGMGQPRHQAWPSAGSPAAPSAAPAAGQPAWPQEQPYEHRNEWPQEWRQEWSPQWRQAPPRAAAPPRSAPPPRPAPPVRPAGPR